MKALTAIISAIETLEAKRDNFTITFEEAAQLSRLIEIAESNIYTDKLDEIALFAKRIAFNIQTGDIKELVRLWLNSNAAFYHERNRSAVLTVVKSNFR
jgi:hypothetical protein